MNKLIFTRKYNDVVSILFENDAAVSINIYDDDEAILDKIYVGRVTNIVKNIMAAFVEISDGISCYLDLNACTNPIFLNNKNTDRVVVNDLILVQVKREAIKTKRPMVTTNIELVSEYAVLMHGKKGVNVSSKIKDADKRRELLNNIKPYESTDYALISRTNAAHADKDLLVNDIEKLVATYGRVIEKAKHLKSGSVVYESNKSYFSDLKNIYKGSVDEIIVEDKKLYDEMKEYLSKDMSFLGDIIRLYDDSVSMNIIYGIDKIIENSLRKNVWLKSGGFIVIEPTEALVAIDVNTGKAIHGKKDCQETFFKINMEAATEIARQIRLRNLSGIIIVDFIDLNDADKKKELMRHFEGLLQKDPVKTVLVDMTGLNLVEVTRKKIKPPLHEKMKKNNHIDKK